MDMITVDVTDLPGAAIGDEVTLWGAGLPVDEVARHVQTIGYELTTRMPARTPRIVTVA
jgi:alanine racemase